MRIDALWEDLRSSGSTKVHRRIDDTHPLDFYAEFEPPDTHGLVLFCSARPPEPRPLRAIISERGQRPDGKWWLRIALSEPALKPVFAGLCHDIITFSRIGLTPEEAAAAMLLRMDRWRALMDGTREGLAVSSLRGLIGELFVLEHLMQSMPERQAVESWNGPLGSPQDFMLPAGKRIEVKTAFPDAACITINGAGQLDPGNDPMELHLIRLAETTADTPDALTAQMLVDRLKGRMAAEPATLNEFESRLAAFGWHAHARHDEYFVRHAGDQCFEIRDGFPRIVAAQLVSGVDDVHYSISIAAARDFLIDPGRIQ